MNKGGFLAIFMTIRHPQEVICSRKPDGVENDQDEKRRLGPRNKDHSNLEEKDEGEKEIGGPGPKGQFRNTLDQAWGIREQLGRQGEKTVKKGPDGLGKSTRTRHIGEKGGEKVKDGTVWGYCL